MQLRVCIIGHCGRAGHRGIESTYENIRKHFFWKSMKSDIATFCNTCLLHAEKLNELIHFDFLFMGKSENGEKYVLILKDDFSSFVLLHFCETADADATVEALVNWFSMFGVVLNWNSDRGSHFKNTVMTRQNRHLHGHHHLTTPYCPQSNGTVETVCREVLRVLRALSSEFRLKETEWPTVVPILQTILNHTKRSGLGNRAPITAFMGLPADNPLRTLLPADRPQQVQSIDLIKA